MNLMQKLKDFFNKRNATTSKELIDMEQRVARLERGYIVLLKRVLELDGVQFNLSKMENFTSKVLQTTNEEINKGLNEPKPTIH